jgi:hypothetical protein
MKTYFAFSLLLASQVFAQTFGTLEVRGEAGNTQMFATVKAQRCDRPIPRKKTNSNQSSLVRSCDQPIYFDLNQEQTLPAGNYILGFENSIYPGLVKIEASSPAVVYLTKIEVPRQFSNEKKLKVFRDFSSLIEQRKIYLEMYFSGKHFFKLTSSYSFGDYYMADDQRADNIQWRTPDLCKAIKSMKDLREHAKFVCDSWNNAKSMADMADIYKFETTAELEGMFQEAWMTEPGDIQAIRHSKHLVAAPMTSADFVSVMPGVYRILPDRKGAKSIQIRSENISENYSAEDLSRDLPVKDIASISSQETTETEEADIDPATSCPLAKIWRTESRSYCVTDNAEGCDRITAKQCQPMRIDIRLRKY